jgi:hypothetical protein
VTASFKSPLRHDESHLRHAHRVCRIHRFSSRVMSGSTLWVAIWLCNRHPRARHDRGRVWAGHRPVAQQRVSRCKRLANTSGPMGDAGRRHECPDAPDRRRGVPSGEWGPGNAGARWVEAVNSPCRTHRGSGSFAGGALSSFPRRMRCRPTPWPRSACNPDAGRRAVRQMPFGAQPHGRDRPRSGADSVPTLGPDRRWQDIGQFERLLGRTPQRLRVGKTSTHAAQRLWRDIDGSGDLAQRRVRMLP